MISGVDFSLISWVLHTAFEQALKVSFGWTETVDWPEPEEAGVVRREALVDVSVAVSNLCRL